MSARDVRYGRRGGRWCDQAPGDGAAFIAQVRAEREAQAAAELERAERDGQQLDLFG